MGASIGLGPREGAGIDQWALPNRYKSDHLSRG